MDEREELARLIENAHATIARWYDEWEDDEAPKIAAILLAVGWRKLPEPGSAEENAMIERAVTAYNSEFNLTNCAYKRPMRAALRAALGLDQPHRENDKRPEG